MNPTEFLIRLIAAFLLVVFVVLRWALGPYLTDAHIPDPESGEVKFTSGLLSVFFGTGRPGEWTLVSLFMARAFLGMMLVSWVLIPAARFFADVNLRYLQLAAVILCGGLSVGCFFLSLLIELVYYRSFV